MTARSAYARWLLLCALALAVVAMHHVPAAHGSAEMASMTAGLADGPALAQGGVRAEPESLAVPAAAHATPSAPDHGGHHSLHLCLAVLAAIALLALVLLGFRAAAAPGPRRRPTLRRAARPPPSPPAGRLLLAAHCVLRI